jgi:hypothetical protein
LQRKSRYQEYLSPFAPRWQPHFQGSP